MCARVGVDGDAPFTNDSLPLGRPISSADNAAGYPSSATHWSSRHLSAFNTRLGRQSRPLALKKSTTPARSWLLVWKAGELDLVPNGRSAQDPHERLIGEAEFHELAPVGVTDPLQR